MCFVFFFFVWFVLHNSFYVDGGARFELENWPEKWQGIYFYLCLHVHGERAVLEVHRRVPFPPKCELRRTFCSLTCP